MSDTKNIVDLDALMPPAVTIKLGEQEIEVQPPTTGDLLRLASLGKKMEGASDLSADEMEKLLDEIQGHIVKIIPELEGKKLNTRQLLKLIEIISEMGTPPEAKELKKAGITPADGSSDPKD